MADSTPSSVDSASAAHAGDNNNPSSNPSAFLAPSDFLPRLPPSTEVPDFKDNDAPTASPVLPNATANLSAVGAAGATTAGSVAPKVLVDAQGRTLNPRSCVTCRKRKVKCDKLHPCSNCSRAHIECVFPSPGRAPRRVRKPGEGRDKELLDRLRRLEGVVNRLGVDVGEEEEKEREKEGAAAAAFGSDTRADSHLGLEGFGPANGGLAAATTETGPAADASLAKERQFVRKTKWVDDQHKGRFENRFGRLVVNEGKSRYVNNSFWASLSSEVEDLKGILNQSSDEEDSMTASPGSNQQAPSAHHGFVFGFSSQNVDLLSLHPLPAQIPAYWEIYKDRVDPLCKVLHVPSLQPTVLNAASHLSNLSRGFETLLFAVYYGATTSLPAHDCLVKFGEEKSVLLARYRFALEQALARANFLTTEEMIVLQAFVIFLICLRRNSDARVIWTLTGLVVRIAQTIGIHRDGSHFGLSTFEIEMRRRLWWQVCILDTRASEDHGCDPTIIEQSFDTKLPLNINDVDISPDSKEHPPERQGCTDMSFCLIRFEMSNTFRRINYIPPGPTKPCAEHLQAVTLEDKEKWIAQSHERLEERYLKHCDMSVPLYWVTATVARLMMSKMWLMVYHPFQRLDGGAKLSKETKEKLFITSLENMEYSLLLETESRTMKWGWLFKTYMQWHALAFCLSELCHRTTGELVERAWKAVEKTRDGRWGVHVTEESNTGHLWRPLKKLYRKARDARQRGLQEEQLNKQFGSNPPTRTYSPNANPMFGHPNRPSMTRAPLSQAQLKRFTEGPVYGQTPLDKHELLRSVQTGDAYVPPKLPDELLQQPQPLQPQPLQPNLDSNLVSETATDLGQTAALGPKPTFGDAFMGDAPNFAFNNFQTSPTLENDMGETDDPLRVNSFDSTGSAGGFDPELGAIMDTSGDLNWENWDQLVRQFGMDVDSGPGTTAAANSTTAWNGSNWEAGPGGANLRLGMGMGGGDWF